MATRGAVPQLADENENVRITRNKAKTLMTQEGGKRKALGEISNLVGSFPQRCQLGGDKAGLKKAGSQDLCKPDKAALGSQAVAKKETGRKSCDRPLGQGPRTRSQTRSAEKNAGAAGAKSSIGMSMSGLLQSRSETAVTPGPVENAVPALPDIDEEHRDNPQYACEYVNDIYKYYRRIEPRVRTNPQYMSLQAEINDKMRSILNDWLVEVHIKFKLMPETLFLTIDLVDRYLGRRQCRRKHLQLVGCTAMLIAAKYEEIWGPEVEDFVYISDRAYTRQQILTMEKIMLNTLKFNLTVPTSYNFLARYLRAAGAEYHRDKHTALMALYLVELALIDYSALQYNYSMVATAAVWASLRMMDKEDAFPPALEHHSGYTLQQILPCAVYLLRLAEAAPTAKLQAVYRKYNSRTRGAVALMPFKPEIIAEAEALMGRAAH